MLNITFTKAAAVQMENRFRERIGDIDMAESVSFSTIHAFCYRLLCRHYGYSQSDILGESDKWVFLKKCLSGRFAGSRLEDAVNEVIQGISFVKNREIAPSAFSPDKIRPDEFVSVFNSYESSRKAARKIDFDDMIILFRDKLRNEYSFYIKER
jgi:DNA helicase-2/ATP-dependent DNA helicase PcrA